MSLVSEIMFGSLNDTPCRCTLYFGGYENFLNFALWKLSPIIYADMWLRLTSVNTAARKEALKPRAQNASLTPSPISAFVLSMPPKNGS